nr:EpsG family protein [Pluralibacter gergoviae]
MNTKFFFANNSLISEATIFFVMMIILSLVVLAYSPLVGYYVPLMILLIPMLGNRFLRVPLIMISITGLSYMAASRNIVSADGSDFEMYYRIYNDILKGGGIFVPEFSGGIEFLLPFIFKVITTAFGSLSREQLLFGIVFIQLFLIVLWLEIFGTRKLQPSEKTLCIVATIGILSVFTLSQALRQSFATVVALYALTAYFSKKRFVFFTLYIISSLFHLTSLIVIPLYIVFYRGKKISYIVLVIMILMGSVFSMLLPFILSHNLLGAATYKLGYYTVTSAHGWDFSTYFKFLIITLCLSYFFSSKENSNINRFTWFTCVVYLALMPIPLASDRFLLLTSSVLSGYLLFFSSYKIQSVLRLMLLSLFIFKILSLGVNYVPGPPLNYWYFYDWAGDTPLYYIR